MQHYNPPTYRRSVTVPALVVDDPARVAARARPLPRAQIELWPDASRALTGEYPERIAERVATVLPGLPGDSAPLQ